MTLKGKQNHYNIKFLNDHAFNLMFFITDSFSLCIINLGMVDSVEPNFQYYAASSQQ
jgi:hypothetical protein